VRPGNTHSPPEATMKRNLSEEIEWVEVKYTPASATNTMVRQKMETTRPTQASAMKKRKLPEKKKAGNTPSLPEVTMKKNLPEEKKKEKTKPTPASATKKIKLTEEKKGGAVNVSSTKDGKIDLFAKEKMAGKNISQVPGIGAVYCTTLKKKNIFKAEQLLGQFLYKNREEIPFKNWLNEECGAPDSGAGNICYEALVAYYNNWFAK